MPGGARLGDKAHVDMDAHGCPACPHSATGPAISASPDVETNGRPALRKDDPGIHAACCGTNMWKAIQGSATVFINNKPAVRQGDQTRHCGGIGRMIEGSPNVMIGEETASGASAAAARQAAAEEAAASSSQAAQSARGSSTASSQSGGGGSDSRASDTDQNNEPQPVLVSATWSQNRAGLSDSVGLSAVAADMAGKSATFTIHDADAPETVVATLHGTCDASGVKATWTTPGSAPPGRFEFTVSCDGKVARSGLLTLVRDFAVKLVLGDDPAAGYGVRLHVAPSGEERTAIADDDGLVEFPTAPFGDVTLFLEDS